MGMHVAPLGVDHRERGVPAMSRYRPRGRAAGALLVSAALMCSLALGPSVSHAWPSDAWIATKAKAALLATKGVKSMGISVETTDGSVTLKGNVPTEHAREKAEVAVREDLLAVRPDVAPGERNP